MRPGGISDRIQRWRHSHGFGVHSPYAYRMVRDVVRPGRAYGYYGYRDIEREAGDDESTEAAHGRLLLRVAATLGPSRVCLPPDAGGALRAAVRAAGRKIRFVSRPSDCELLVADGATVAPEAMAAHLSEAGHSLLAWGQSGATVERLAGAMPGGMLLHGRGTVLAVVREGMPLVCHSVNFR